MSMKWALAATALMLAGCGKVADLEPQAGHALPPKPAVAKATPDAAALLRLPTQAAPGRVDELLKKGKPREPDRFDLPPPDGSGQDPTPSTTGPDNADEPK
jgi:hypothetical protein